ncbi:Protein disulfide isomerase [Tenacibaculum sediminilitoris]|uniref:thioredoxin family protein n=1 Tax=Tenacibaculum sediminilitoris TaxID=1820334 RepID=UPI003895ACD7
MKKIFLLVVVMSVCISSYSQEKKTDSLKTTNWESSYNKALKKVKEERKPMLIYFKGSDWCGPCKKLDKELFSTEKFKKLSEKNFILYEADIPFNEDLVENEKLGINKKLAKKYKVSSYPTILFINHKQKIIAYKKGLLLTEYYYPFFESVINKKRG